MRRSVALLMRTVVSELPIEGQTAPTAEQLAVGEVVRQRPEFWNGVLRAIGTDPRSAREIGGASGVRHSALGVGVNETEKRIVIVSASGDARSAALAQADIQSAISDYKVIVARPTVVSAVASAVGTSTLSLRSLGMFAGMDGEQELSSLTG